MRNRYSTERYALIALLILLVTPGLLMCQQADYEDQFGTDYVYALRFINDNSFQFSSVFPDTADRQVASAIIFPELIRYNALRDLIETATLKTLYVQYGSTYANFSVGPFQMKPAFAEKIEREWRRRGGTAYKWSWLSDTLQNNEYRYRRLERLGSLDGQIIYLYMFYQLMEDRFTCFHFESTEDKIRIYAAAYNGGMDLSTGRLRELSDTRQFHTGLFSWNAANLYNYADIAVYYFRQSCSDRRVKGLR
ncbi:MAG: hypothetical protein ACQEQW_07930 [Bacteroidota bacterium]